MHLSGRTQPCRLQNSGYFSQGILDLATYFQYADALCADGGSQGEGLTQTLFFLPERVAVSVKATEEIHAVNTVCHEISKHATGFPAKMSSRVS